MDSDKPLVGIVMGSDSDWPLVKKACETLDRFEVPYETRVISAHRTPEMAIEYSKSAEGRGIKVIIAAAGGAAHLGGVLAAGTVLPVIGIPESGRDRSAFGIVDAHANLIGIVTGQGIQDVIISCHGLGIHIHCRLGRDHRVFRQSLDGSGNGAVADLHIAEGEAAGLCDLELAHIAAVDAAPFQGGIHAVDGAAA